MLTSECALEDVIVGHEPEPWSFIDRNDARLLANERMRPIVAGWRKRDEAAKEAIRGRAAEVLELAERGESLLDPDVNLRVAYEIWSEQGWRPWACK